MFLQFPVAASHQSEFIRGTGSRAAFILSASQVRVSLVELIAILRSSNAVTFLVCLCCEYLQWSNDVVYDDPLFSTTREFIQAYNNFSEVLSEDSQNVSFAAVTDRGVAAAAVGTLLTTALQQALGTCRVIGPADIDR
jgi:hypothetical protein